jgi:hypothetical protein
MLSSMEFAEPAVIMTCVSTLCDLNRARLSLLCDAVPSTHAMALQVQTTLRVSLYEAASKILMVLVIHIAAPAYAPVALSTRLYRVVPGLCGLLEVVCAIVEGVSLDNGKNT